MTDLVIGCDTNTGNDEQVLKTVADGLKQKGYNVAQVLSIGPTPFSQYGYTDQAKGKIGIYLMAASLISYADGAHDQYDKDIFVIRGDASPRINTQEAFNSTPIRPDPDCNEACNEFDGMTYPEMNKKTNGKCVAVYGGTTPEEMLNAAIAALNGVAPTGGSSNQSSGGGGGAVKIPDLTFYGLIKQILGAVDGVFIIANNMAYLLSFKQLYTYRDKYEDYILELQPSEIITDSIIRNWTTDGFYNSVEVTYADGIIKMQHDALVSTYGENVFYYEFPEDDEETAKAKADALLSAHVRDYSIDLQLNCLYNPNITVGAWIKVPKTLTKISGPTSKTSGELAKKNKEEKKLHKGVNITNMNEIIQKINGKEKTIQKITTEDEEEYEVEIEKKDYEIYFVQGYKLRWTPDESPIMSLHLKYGPDTPEDPVNATVGTGGVQSGGTTGGGGGGYGNDCFWIGEIMPNNNDYINSEHYLAPGDLDKPEFQPQPQHYAPRCKKGSNLDKDMSGKTPQEVHNAVRAKFGYCSYAESSTKWPCVSDMYDQACGTNCGDGARILKCALDAINVKSWGVHINGHYFCAAELNGKKVALDATGFYDYSNTAGWPAGPKPENCCEPGQADSVRMF